MSTTGIYKNQVTMTHNSRQLTSDLGFFCKVKIIESGRFERFYYCRNLKFGMRI